MFDEFVSFLDDEAGDFLRAAGWYEDESFEILYLRGDIDPDEAQERADALHSQLTWDWSPPEEQALRAFGEKLASVNMHEDVVILHFPARKAPGIVVTLDVDVARNLHEFIEDCLNYLDYLDTADFDRD